MKLEKIKIKKNKKGSMVDLLIWLALSFTILLFFAGWIYGFNIITDTLIAIPTTTTTNTQGDPFTVNISDAAKSTFGVVNTAQTRGLHILSWVMIISMALTILLTNFLVKAHPAFFVVYLLVIIAAIISSVYISNQYEELMVNEVLGTTLSEFKGGSFIMLNLPLFTIVIGVFGAIFLFGGILRDIGAGGSVV